MFEWISDRSRERQARIALAVVALITLATALASNGDDAIAYRSAAARLLETGSPYQAFQLAGPFDPSAPGALSYLYPPVFALLITPLTLLPYFVSVSLFALASVFATFAAFYLVVRDGGLRRGDATLVAVFAVMVFPAMVNDAANGNVSGLLALAFALILVAPPQLAGIALAAATVLKLTPAALAPGLLARAPGALRPALATGLLLLAPSLLVFGAWAEYPTVLANLIAFGPSQHWPSGSPAEAAATLFGAAAYGPVRAATLVVAAGCLLLAGLAALRGAPRTSLAAGLWGGLLAPATLWPHYLLSVEVLVLYLLVRTGRRARLLLAATSVAALVLPDPFHLAALRLTALPLLVALTLLLAARVDAGQRSDKGRVQGS